MHKYDLKINQYINIMICTKTSKKLCKNDDCTICYDKSFASSEMAKCWMDKNNVTPRQVFKCTNKKYWFKCDKSGHEYQAVLNGGHFCSFPCCANQKLCNDENCKLCYNASFASHEKAKYWSDKNDAIPRQVFKGSGKKFWFKCNKSNHEFDVTLSNIIFDNSWCPYACCASQKLCNDDNCKICFNDSFASNDKAILWLDKNNKIPREVFKGSSKKYWFKCDISGHEFEKLLYHITTNDTFCPFPCCGNQQLCINNNCKMCYNASFASSENILCWSNKNTDDPRDIFKFSQNKYKFTCKTHEDFLKSAGEVSHNISCCPKCNFANEMQCMELIEKISGYKFKKTRPPFLDGLELDGYNSSIKLAIEYNGGQHYKYIPHFHRNGEEDFVKQQERDARKIKLCEKNDIHLIIISHEVKNKEKFIQEEYEKYCAKTKIL